MKDDRTYLLHIRDAITRVVDYTRDGKTAFFTDAKTQDAVIRNLEIIGEATKCLSEAVRDRSPEVPWKQIARMRDTLIHRYFGVKLELVWEVVEQHLGALQARVDAFLAEPQPPTALPESAGPSPSP